MRWFLIVLGLLAAIVAAVVVVGMMLPQNHTASRAASLPAAPEKVWAAITEVGDYPAWRGDVDSVAVLSSGGKLSWREISGSDRITYEVVSSKPVSHFVVRIADKGLPFGGSWDYRLEPEGTATRLTITENGEVYNPVFRFVSKILMGHTATIDKYLRDLTKKIAASAPEVRGRT